MFQSVRKRSIETVMAYLLALDDAERLARARADLRMGLPVVLTHDGASALALSAETATARRVDGLKAMGGATLAISDMAELDGVSLGSPQSENIEAGATTGA